MKLNKKIAIKAMKKYLKLRNQGLYEEYDLKYLKLVAIMEDTYLFSYEDEDTSQLFRVVKEYDLYEEKDKSINVGLLLSFYDEKFKYIDGKLKRLKNEKHKD